jgi:hypothetical protein
MFKIDGNAAFEVLAASVLKFARPLAGFRGWSR